MLLSRSIHLRRACGTALVLLAVACGGPAERPASPIASAIPPSPGPSIARTALPTSTVAPTAAPTPVVGVGEPWIAFTPDGPYQVRLVRPDGTDMHSPTGDVPPGTQTNPDWSRDGQTLVFGLTSGTRDDLWIVGADGRGARVLLDCEAPCAWFDDPAWAPDGRGVLFSRMAEVGATGVGTLERVTVDSGAVEVLATAAPKDFYAGQRWSPDGRSVVLEVVHRSGTAVSDDIVGVDLAIIELADPRPAGRRLVAPGLWPETAAWTPDGKEIVFAALPARGGEGKDLYAIRPDGTGLRRLTTLADQGGNATHPDVSPDGRIVVFSATLAGERPILASVPIAGGAWTQATLGEPVRGVHPRLRPAP